LAHGNIEDIYDRLRKKIDGTTVRTSWNQALCEILKTLYTTEEAELLIRMPYGISRFEKIVISTKCEKTELLNVLEKVHVDVNRK
jgi:hypothetical protein